MKTMGLKISEYRKQKGLTQEELASRLNVTPQAVSKWENDLSIPDLPILIEISNLFHISLDALIRQEERHQPMIVDEKLRKDMNQMFLRVTVDSISGDRVRINLPLSIIKIAIDLGTKMPEFISNPALKEVDFKMIYELIEKGMIGKIVEVDTADGEHVEIYVE